MRGFVVALTTVVLAAGSVVGAEGQSSIGLRALEARLGLVSIDAADGSESTFGISGGADLGRLTKDLGLEVGIDFWTKGWDVGDAEWSYTNIAFLGNVRYAFKSASSFQPFLFGGIAFCYQSSDWEDPLCNDELFEDLCDFEDSSLEFGIDIGAGADFGSGDGMIPTARVGYNSNGGADYFFLQGGVKFPLGK